MLSAVGWSSANCAAQFFKPWAMSFAVTAIFVEIGDKSLKKR
jgi:hypothetical protein